MKKSIITLIIIAIIAIMTIATINNMNQNTDTTSQKILQVNEVTRSVFYAPQYLAISNGFFKEEGLEIELTTGQGADKVMTAVLSGQSDLGFCGPEAAIYVYNEGKDDYIEVFAQMTQKDGSFLVSKEATNNFQWSDLKGKTVIPGRKGGVPYMTFEYVLKQNGINPQTDLILDDSIKFDLMAGAFAGGNADYVTLFEPTATLLENQGYGYVVASIGKLGGVVPYTSFSARDSFIKNNKDLIGDFDSAIQKGLDFVSTHTDSEVAEVILKQFPDTSFNDLVSAIKRYRENDTWPKTTTFTEDSFNHLQDIMIDYGELEKRVSYNDLMYKIK